jgi:hypothetical protein
MGMQALSETVRKERKELAEAAKQQEEGADKSESKDSKGAGQEPRRSKRGAGTKPAAARKDAAKACADPAAANKKCEDCQLKVPSFGLPAEGKKRWCSGCAKAHAGAVAADSWKSSVGGAGVEKPKREIEQAYLSWQSNLVWNNGCTKDNLTPLTQGIGRASRRTSRPAPSPRSGS